LVRRFLDERRTQPSGRTGRRLDSHALHTTARVILAWLNWLVAEGELDANVPKRVKMPRKEQKVLKVLDKRQIDRLFLAADSGPQPARDRAILAVLLDTGLCANELCSLERRDVSISPDAGYLLVRHGKGRRQREVPLGKKARLALAR
jgi:site-specific recombinase XerC